MQTASGYDVAWKNTSTGQYTVWTTDSNGNYTGNLIGAVSGNSYALESLEPIFRQDLNGDGVIGLYTAAGTTQLIRAALVGTAGSATIGTGATLELSAADSASVTFAGATGTLRLDHSSTFSGEMFNFTGNGSLSGSDQIDLRNIKYNSVHDSYANGVLTLTDGSDDTAKLNFNGSYTLANFKFANDGSGGTIVYDPPVTSRQSATASGAECHITNDWDRNDSASEGRKPRTWPRLRCPSHARLFIQQQFDGEVTVLISRSWPTTWRPALPQRAITTVP